MKMITKTELNETRGYRVGVSEKELSRMKTLTGEQLLELSEVPNMRFDHIEIGENFITVHDRGVQNVMAKNGYEDASTTWTIQEWDKEPSE